MMRLRTGVAATALLLLLAGCTVGPNYHRPTAAASAPAWRENGVPPPNPPNGTWKQAEPSDAVLRGRWWETYDDPQLNALEERIAVSNQTLKVAMEQYFQAREQVQVARSQYYPTLGLGVAGSRIRNSNNQPNTVPGATHYQYDDFSINGQAQWEPDLWGQVRRTVEQTRANAQASAALLANVDLSVRSELASDYFEMRGLDSQKQLLDNTVTAYESYLHLTQIRFKGGVATESDVALAQTQLDTTRAQDIDVGVARAQYEHAIATLVGESASVFSLPEMPLGEKIPPIPVGVPSELLERRPDIAAAERQVDAANAQIGIAITAYYPNVSLNGTGGFLSGNPGTLIQGPSEMWSLGASAVELLFDAGRRHAITQQARDAYEQQVANYRQTVLAAFQDVEDNLAALRILDQESVANEAAVASAQRSLTISTGRYKGGVTTYLEVLTAQTVQLTNERTQEDIATRQFVASVQLIRALGGGWDTTQLPKM
ncbi:MAG TPA: efflux transporter outer membrane subunit [Acidobacteriaceae bacterium]|jgi:NodT family efflux transporter outer membrane factor (OMF) lipoprotein|nr:efflux transporter outer membrane subunit [Acidobacteriaceae bacterium]